MDGSVPKLVPDEVDVNVSEEKGTSGATCTMTRCTSVKFRVKTGCLVMDVKLWSAVGGLAVWWCGGLRKLLVATESQRTGVGGSERQTLTKLTVLRGFTPLEQMSRWA